MKVNCRNRYFRDSVSCIVPEEITLLPTHQPHTFPSPGSGMEDVATFAPLVTDTRDGLQNVPGCWQCDNLGLFFRATVRLPTFAKPPFVSRHENAGAFLSTLQTLNTGNRNFSKLCRSSAPPVCSARLGCWVEGTNPKFALLDPNFVSL